ncbi:hypothetical protein CHLNCDRAFT_53485 [Chlorella variabilis]|uniref:Uncharacterized protein n=1 Tax=Chlorella variabilis TaxID=554065 RepID=E1ZJB0_CHLVA|nr:hypothetical protein CHLNCDRAFT_53485 [Chlorella variabilis]EFN53965.1 hypothetical protein CHLNCDRAFT_53485 [Chlorella variabilis]|eukprot:XP_005846067.1 hypothetical protein CHLNCDRAFT_53485 [Chlorella variabilis]
MPLSKATVGLALCAVGAGAVLGHGLLPLLRQGALPAPGTAFALVRYEGWVHNLLAVQLFCCAVVAGIVRLGSRKSIGPSAQLALFHDGHALVGAALAVGLHGGAAAWPLAFMCVGRALVGAAQALRLRVGVASALVWAYAAIAVLVTNASEGAGAGYWCERLLGPSSALAPAAAALDAVRGVAPAHFTAGLAFRYTAMRFVSWALDTLSGRVVEATRSGAVERACAACTAAAAPESPRIAAVVPDSPVSSPAKVHATSRVGLASATWPAFFSYMLHVPTYLAGPLLTAADYYQQAAAASAGLKTAAPSLAGAAWWRAAARMAGCVAFAELLRRTFFADAAVQALLAQQPWQSWALGYCVLTALYAQSYVPWTFARLCSGALGIATADEVPLGFLASSTSPRTFWRSFHVSWYRWLCAYVYVPLGGSTAALAATLAVSTLLHGTHRRARRWAWLTWGAIQCGALLAERWMERRGTGPLSRLHPHLRAALAQCATQTTLLVQLPLGPSLPKFLACFHAVNLPFCVLNAARLAAAAKGGGRAGGGGKDALFQRRKPAKLAWE